MSKQTKMWLGIALLGAAGYMLWKKGSNKASFVGNTPTTKQKL